ncbi:MAG: glycoside hydrolase family 88 protein [Candidatus Acidiferrales bacterium]
MFATIPLGLALACIFSVNARSQQARTAEDRASDAGDSLAETTPIATELSARLDRDDVLKAMRKVADWQLDRAQPHFNQDWTYAALYAGFMAVPPEVEGDKYRKAMQSMAEKFDWQLGPRLTNADDEAIGQTYLELYRKLRDPKMIAPTQQRMDDLMKTPDPTDKALWWWCDALFMAPPVLARLYGATGDVHYLDFMDHEWWITSHELYDPQQHLFSRDASYLDKREANGNKLFWARGNGWVMGGLVRVLQFMPENYPTRAKYVQQFRDMAAAVAPLQGNDGLWRTGLLDEEAYSLPENSASAFFAYAFAWGVNQGILDRRVYEPVVEKAWAGLLAHVYEDGRLGSIQPVGGAPGPFTETSSYVYGVGAFLLAGSEIYRLAH